MDKYKVRVKRFKFLVAENRILIVLVVFRFVELRPDAVVEKEKLQYQLDVAGGRSSEDRNLLICISDAFALCELSS